MSETIWSECKSCNQSTKHAILKQESFRSDPSEYYYGTDHMMIQCLGCENIAFRKEEHDFEAYYQIGPDEWEHDTKVDIYPHFISHHNSIDNISKVPLIVRSIYYESIITIQEAAYTLAGLGLRATIEAICNEQGITGKNLQVRINKMSTQGLISKRDAQRLHAIRFLGNDAAHEIKKAKKGSVLVALKIVEHILLTLYILDEEVNQHLETTITTFDELKTVLEKNISSFPESEIITFRKWLGKDYRRVIENNQSLERQLVELINDTGFNDIELADIPNQDGTTSQGYKLKSTEETEEISTGH